MTQFQRDMKITNMEFYTRLWMAQEVLDFDYEKVKFNLKQNRLSRIKREKDQQKLMKKMKKKEVKISKNKKVPPKKAASMRKKPGGSNVGEYKNVESKEFAGPSGGAPKGSYPINTKKRAKAALAYAHNAPNPEGIKKKVHEKYPSLGKNSKSNKKKKGKS